MQSISRNDVQRKMSEGAQLVEVLAEEYYNKFHLPSAINVPLDEQFDEHIQSVLPDKEAEIVVYCQNLDCPASPEAGKRMDELGYKHVYDYEAGKEDWQDAGLPIEP